MKKLTSEESEQLIIFKGRKSRIHQMLSTLKPGESLLIEKEKDWISKQPPYRIINRFAKKTGWKLTSGRTLDGKGWGVKRVS